MVNMSRQVIENKSMDLLESIVLATENLENALQKTKNLKENAVKDGDENMVCICDYVEEMFLAATESGFQNLKKIVSNFNINNESN